MSTKALLAWPRFSSEILRIGLERDGDFSLIGHDSTTDFNVTIRDADGTETTVQQATSDNRHHIMSHDDYVRAHLDAVQARYQELSQTYLNAVRSMNLNLEENNVQRPNPSPLSQSDIDFLLTISPDYFTGVDAAVNSIRQHEIHIRDTVNDINELRRANPFMSASETPQTPRRITMHFFEHL